MTKNDRQTRSQMFRKAALFLFPALALIFFYQNCGNINLTAKSIDSSSALKCLDDQKDLTIWDTRNTGSTSVAAGVTDFQIYENKDGQLVVFQPEDESTEWPPRWYKDALNGAPAFEGALFRTNFNSGNCVATQIQARLNVCGTEVSLDRQFSTAFCSPVQCSEHGVSRQTGEIGTFYKSQAGTCTGPCESITRVCQADGTFSAALGDSSANINEYTFSSCTNPQASTCQQNPTVSIPGTGQEPTQCGPETGNPTPTTGQEPPIPRACLNVLPELTTGRVHLPFGPVSSDYTGVAEIQSLFNNGYVTRNTSFNNAYDYTCTGNFNPNSFQHSAGFGKTEFVAMRFKTKDEFDFGSFRAFAHSIGATNGSAMMSVSECPGDFGKIAPSIQTLGSPLFFSAPQMRTLLYYSSQTASANATVAREVSSVGMDQCIVAVENPDVGANLDWTTDRTRSPGCLLEKNKTYYLNIVYRRPANLHPSCPRHFPLENPNLQGIGMLNEVNGCSFNYVPTRNGQGMNP